MGDEIRKLWQTDDLRGHTIGYLASFLVFGAVFAISVAVMGRDVETFVPGCGIVCFFCIGLSTRFRDLMTFGLKPFWAFTIGVIVNVPLGYFLSTVLFSKYWSAISKVI